MKTQLMIMMITVMCLSAFSLTAQNMPKYTLNAEMFQIKFSTLWSWDDIKQAKDNLAESDIILKYTLLEFDEDGMLKRISASIEYPDGMGGSFISRDLKPDEMPGFRRNFIKHPLGKK